MKTKWFTIFSIVFSLVIMMGHWMPEAQAAQDYVLGPGDVIRITVFQNPELTQEIRVSDVGDVSYPLIGTVKALGLTTVELEALIAERLRSGGFLLDPQVSILLLQVKGNQATVLGFVRSPGRIPLEQTAFRVTDVLALAGGVLPDGAEQVRLTGVRDGLPFQRIIDLVKILKGDRVEEDITIMPGDVLYVPRGPVFYIYGEVQRPGAWRVERGMTLRQAIASSGGLTPRGTFWRMEVRRRNADGETEIIKLGMEDIILEGDVIEIKESWF